MFWRSVVGKLAMTILLLVSFVLFIITILLMEFYENFHIQEAEKNMIQTATKISSFIRQGEEDEDVFETTERVKDPATQVVIMYGKDEFFVSEATDKNLSSIDHSWFREDIPYEEILNKNEAMYEQKMLPESDTDEIVVGIQIQKEEVVIFVYQSFDFIEQTKSEITSIIFLAADIAIILTTFFAFRSEERRVGKA